MEIEPHANETQAKSDETLKEEVKELEEINKKQEARIQSLETKALTITNLFFVFQGVILSSLAQKELKCSDKWIPFTLSLLASVLNAGALLHTIYSFVRCREELDQNYDELNTLKKKLKSKDDEVCEDENKEYKPDRLVLWIRRVIFFIGFLLFLGFSVVILVACFTILC